VGGLRPAMMANYLVKAGHECAVLTVSLDAILQRDPEFLKVDERITEMRVSPILINPYESYLPAGVSPGFLHKVIRRMMTYWAPDVYYFWAIRAARAYVRHPPLKPEVVISSALPFSVHHAGRIIAKKFKAIWVADCRDLWAGNPHLGMSLKRQEWAFVHQSKLLSMASYVLGVSDEMVDILRESLPNHVPSATLMNAFNEEEISPIAEKMQDNSTGFSFVYTGSLYNGQRDLGPFFEALSRVLTNASRTCIPVRIIYAGHDGRALIEQASKYNLQGIIRNRGWVSRQESLHLQRKADALLLSIGDGSEKGAIIVTGKVFEYLSSRRPILGLGYPKGALGRLLRDTNAGYIFSPDNLRDICSVVSRWLAEFEKSGSISWNGVEEQIMKHSWKYRIKELLTMIERLHGRRISK